MRVRRGATLAIDAPRGATKLRLGGAGKLLVVDVVDGSAVVSATDTAEMPAGDYAAEWEVVAGADVALLDGPRIRVVSSLLADALREAPQTHNERLLAAARATLETAAQSAELSLSVEGTSLAFETRADLLRFVRDLELRVARQRRLPRRVHRVTL